MTARSDVTPAQKARERAEEIRSRGEFKGWVYAADDITQALLDARNDALTEAEERVQDLWTAYREINGRPTVLDLVKLQGRIRDLKSVWK